MLSEKQIEALKAGAYGVTRDGYKAKYIGVSSRNYHCWAIYDGDATIGDVLRAYKTFHIYDLYKQDSFDIVGLWEDRPEPFNLHLAMTGKRLIHLDTNEKYFLVGKGINIRKNTYFIMNTKHEIESIDKDLLDVKFGMWNDPEPVKPSADLLPKPIKEFGDLTELWRIIIDYEKNKYIPYKHNKGTGWTDVEKIRLANGCYYATKDDCQAICDWLMNR